MTVGSVIEQVTRRLIYADAQAVVLTGSHARGDATIYSDVDLVAIGDGPDYRLEMHAGLLVSTSWQTRSEVEETLRSPSQACAAVPAWRSARILYDPNGIAAELVASAQNWQWDDIGEARLTAWVAEELTGYAEEVFKLVAMLEQRRLQAASVQRSVLTLRIPMIMATHLRLLYDSENVLWDMVGDVLDGDWRELQSAAFGLSGEPFQESCLAALELYVRACERVMASFDSRQLAVVEAAIRALESHR